MEKELNIFPMETFLKEILEKENLMVWEYMNGKMALFMKVTLKMAIDKVMER